MSRLDGGLPVAHILSVWLTTALRLMTRTVVEGAGPPSAAGGGVGITSFAFVTDIDAGKIMGRISDMMGRREAILGFQAQMVGR